MVILSKTGIYEAISDGDIVVHPFTQSAVSNNSIDIRLGKWFFRQKKQVHTVEFPLFTPASYCPKESEKILNLGTDDYCQMWGSPIQADGCITLSPGETILATSEEFIGAKQKYTTMLKTKSSLARLGLDLCGSAGWGDVGYINRWAFPLTNRSSYSLSIPVNAWVGQLVFMEISHTEADGYPSSGQYQKSDNLQTIIDTWTPESILPQKPLKAVHV